MKCTWNESRTFENPVPLVKKERKKKSMWLAPLPRMPPSSSPLRSPPPFPTRPPTPPLSLSRSRSRRGRNSKLGSGGEDAGHDGRRRGGDIVPGVRGRLPPARQPPPRRPPPRARPGLRQALRAHPHPRPGTLPTRPHACTPRSLPDRPNAAMHLVAWIHRSG